MRATIVTQELLANRYSTHQQLGYPKQNWIEFCEEFLCRANYEISLYEAKQSNKRKYIILRKNSKKFRVHFTSHSPMALAAIAAALAFFGELGTR